MPAPPPTTSEEHAAIATTIVRQARTFGADLAGLARVEELKRAPSFFLAPRLPGAGQGIETAARAPQRIPGEVCWPAPARSVLVIALAHPADRPELDWWQGHTDPPGNRLLIRIVRQLCGWIEERYAIETAHLPYHVERGGIFLKDAAVLAGLGCIGRNNLLLTPQYGPRVRLRALTLAADLPASSGPAFDPCRTCSAPCRSACPQSAFGQHLYHATDFFEARLPGRDGTFARPACMRQMQADIDGAADVPGTDPASATSPVIRYCRACELNCPVGRR